MTTLAQVREGIALNLSTIADVQVSAYMLGNPTPPAIEVVPEQVTYDLAFQRGMDQWNVTVRAFVGLTTDVGAQKRLDLMLASSGANSVKAAVEASPTLGGAVDDLRVTRASGYRTYTFEGRPPVLGAEWAVEVFATG